MSMPDLETELETVERDRDLAIAETFQLQARLDEVTRQRDAVIRLSGITPAELATLRETNVT